MNGKRNLNGILGVAILTLACVAHGRIWYVDDDAVGLQEGTTWNTAFRTLQQALVHAENGDTIRMAQGTYRPVDDTSPSLPLVLARGGGTGSVVLPRYWQIDIPLTIQGGYVGLGDPCHPDTRAPGLYPTVLNGDLSRNDIEPDQVLDLLTDSTRSDNAPWLFHLQPKPAERIRLDGLTLTGARDSAIYHSEGNCSLEHCTFLLNSGQDGGAVQSVSRPYDSPLTVRYCAFIKNAASNRGGAIRGSSSERLHVEACRFLSNVAGMEGGAVYYSGSEPGQIHNSIFSANNAPQGGALVGSLTLSGCSLAYNGSNWGFYSPSGGHGPRYQVNVYNSILHGGSGHDPSNLPMGAIAIEHSLLPIAWPGVGNRVGEPLFVDANGSDGIAGTEDDDLRLASGSPAINAGSNALVSGSSRFDINGRPRNIGTVDMGAYESGHVWHVDVRNRNRTRRGPEPEGLGLSPEEPFGSIHAAIEAADHGDLILVYPGDYQENFELLGKRVTLRGIAGPRGLPVVGVTLRCPCGTIGFYHNEGPDTVLENLIVRDCGIALEMKGASPTLRNLTITDNTTGLLCDESSFPTITNCILWNNQGDDLINGQARYSCIQHITQAKGDGNIAQDPLFADPEQGDYRLSSVGGRYQPAQGAHVQDVESSPCIDAGDPAEGIGLESSPHGTRINMGAYGGTYQASLSQQLPPQVIWFNYPTADVIGVMPIMLSVKTSDTDGRVVAVTFYANGQKLSDFRYPAEAIPSHSPGQPWTLYWLPPSEGGTFTLTAVAIDDDGLTTASPPLFLTVDPNLRISVR